MPIENPPEIILHNGVISTQADANPLAQAVALGRGCIIAVGGDEDIRYLAGPDTQIIDLAGRLVTPGFIDTHIHFYEWAFNRQGLKLDGLSCLEDLLDLVGRASRDRPQRQWIMGQGWNETDWAQPRMPTRDVLDQVAPDHPVILWRCDMHLAAANSTALRMAAIDAGTADPPEGRIERDGQGEPTGILRELAINLIRKAISPPSANHARQTFTDAMRALHRRGVTGIHDTRLMDDETGADSFRTFQSLDRDGALNLRTWVTLPGHKLEEIIDLGICTGFGGQRLRTGHVKFFSDGGMGARTAWMLDPFLDADRGMPLMDMAELARQVEKADRAGLSVMVHAVGDRANREVISIFEALKTRREKSNTPPPAIEHRIEHLQMIRPEDALRLGDLGVGLCVTPANLLLDINLIDTAVGEKGKWAYAFRRLIDTGAPVMFSSDCPVCDPDPLLGIQAAVNRQRIDGTPEGGWHAQNRVTVAEALRAYTATPAAFYQAHYLGTIAPGKRADLVVLSQNILDKPSDQLPETRVEMTLFDGHIVHRLF